MVRKSVKNKRAVIIVASSLAAIPLTAVLIAVATRKGRRKSLQTSRFLGQTRLKNSVITTATHSQQQKEKPQPQPQSPWQGSEINKQTETTTTTAATIISTNAIVDEKDITTPEVVLSPTVPSGTSDNAVIVSSSQTSKEEEISVSDEARKAGELLKELVVKAIKEAKDSATGTGKQLKEQTIDIAATADSKDIHSLGD
nr:hypothetical protein [Thermoproteota archaeon]